MVVCGVVANTQPSANSISKIHVHLRLQDAEIRRILDEQYGVARGILEEKRSIVEAMTNALMEWETIDAEQVKAIMEGREPKPPAGWVKRPTPQPPSE